MRIFLFYSIIFLVLSCAKDNAPNCIQIAGDLTTIEHNIDPFDRILANENIELFLLQGSEYNLKIESGEHLISDINYTIDNSGLLTLNDNNQCNWVRNYAPTKIFVTTPNLKEIRSNTQYTIKSEGILTFPNLKLISENFNQDNISSGDFNLHVQNESVSVISNNISQFFISGSTDTLFVGFYSGTTAFFGANLLAQDVEISHRSSHDITVYPVQSLSGVLRSTGNLISVNEPPNVDVSVLYTGSLIFIN
jgi:hypothetical protein